MRKNILFALFLLSVGCGPAAEDQLNDSLDTEELIIGGHSVTKKSDIAATTVSLLDSEKGTLCTASILSDNIAITAAHCVDGDPVNMQISFGPRSAGHVVRPVEEVATSPAWARHQNDEKDSGDIALVKFAGGLPTGAHSATLMPASHLLSDGEIVTLAGFGISNGRTDTGAGTLRSVDVKIVQAGYSRTEVLLDQTHNKGACHGDSGGPAFIQARNGGLLLWGVTSRGVHDPKNECAGDSIYTKIRPYARWVNGVAKAWSTGR